MLPTSLLRQAAASTSSSSSHYALPALASLPIKSIPPPPSLPRKTGQPLFPLLSSLPNDGVGYAVLQTRWRGKGIKESWWVVSRVRVKAEGTRGKAWGRLVWKGKVVSDKPEEIRGGLKYLWTTASPLPMPLPHSPPTASAAAAAAAAPTSVGSTQVEGNSAS